MVPERRFLVDENDIRIVGCNNNIIRIPIAQQERGFEHTTIGRGH